MKASGISQQILITSIRILTDWENGSVTLDAALDALRQEQAPERPAVASLLFEYFRHKAFIDELISHHAKKDRVRQDMRLLLAAAATQIYFQTGIAVQSAVNIAVDCGKIFRGPGGGGFVNAMLRSFLRDNSVDPSKIAPSFPDSLLTRWKKNFGTDKAQETMSLFASNPPLAFRLRDASVREEILALGAQQLPASDFDAGFEFYEIADPAALFEKKELLDSAKIYIQDPSTALPLSLLDGPPKGHLLDACAAPGGKTVMLSDRINRADARLTASDRSAKRLAQMTCNLRRAGIVCRSIQADAVSMPFSPASFDFILADAPCSNTGVIRRRPDAPWRFTPARLAETAALQKSILDSLAKLVKSGGLLVYSTCSIEPEEDDLQIAAFLERNPDFTLKKQRLLTPDAHHDGAFSAILEKRK